MNILQNKKAIVTGASKGIGRAISLNLAKNGCDLFLISRTEQDLKKVKDEILQNYKVNVSYHILDITNFESVKTIFETIIIKANSIDILINNAGITKDNILARMNLNQWNDVINTNLNGYFNCCKHIIKHMMKNKYGRIINISSIIGKNGNPGQINYSSSKAGLVGLTKSLSKEVGARNITVNSVAPGFIKTDMTKDLDESNKNIFLENISLKRFGNAEEVAELTTFLASDKASYITGQTINIDGGIY
tara:strand:- start:7775 stop:8518 length:744 start_codon:yes stop_codon:yes gene_type:complete